jgi:hypothetical protein
MYSLLSMKLAGRGVVGKFLDMGLVGLGLRLPLGSLVMASLGGCVCTTPTPAIPKLPL